MKANELMIGDWVQIDEPDKYAGAKGTICSLMHHHSDEGRYFHVFVQDLGVVMREVFNEDLRPIPLTAEILEKNGFVEQKYGWRKLNAANWCININIFNGKERYALSVLGINTQVSLHGYYVHELQHALRLCGIDKEIVL